MNKLIFDLREWMEKPFNDKLKIQNRHKGISMIVCFFIFI